jgi:hypothetical protein
MSSDILTIKWFATANLLNVSIYAGKWLAPMSQTTSYCVYKQVFVYRRMPKGNAPRLTDLEYRTLKLWIDALNL